MEYSNILPNQNQVLKNYKIEFFSRTEVTPKCLSKLLDIIAHNFAIYKFNGSIVFVSTYKSAEELKDFLDFILNTKNIVIKLDYNIVKI